MKVIKTKLIQKAEGRKRGKYEITLEISDYDIDMIEDFATTLAPNEIIEEPSKENNWNGVYSSDYKDKYLNWISKLWHCFWKPWNLYCYDKKREVTNGKTNSIKNKS